MPTTPTRRPEGSPQTPRTPRRTRRAHRPSAPSLTRSNATLGGTTPSRNAVFGEVLSGRINRASRARLARGPSRTNPRSPLSQELDAINAFDRAVPPPSSQPPQPGSQRLPLRSRIEPLSAEELFAHLFPEARADGVRTPRPGTDSPPFAPQSPAHSSSSGASTPRLATPGSQTPRPQLPPGASATMTFLVSNAQGQTVPMHMAGGDIFELWGVVQDVFVARDAHIIVAPATPPNPRGVDVENVMWKDRMCRTNDSILAVQAAVRFAPRGAAAITKLVKDLEALRRDDVAVPAALSKIRLGLPEYENALRTLRGCALKDRTPPLTENPAYVVREADESTGTEEQVIGLADLLGLILGAIDDYKHPDGDEATARDRAIMGEGLLTALARCYDTDLEDGTEVPPSEAFRVCGIGIVQRLVSVLQTFIAGVRIDADERGLPMTNPGELLSQFAQEFHRDLGGEDPSQQWLDAFCAGAKARARDFWDEGSRELRTFDAQLETYLCDDYGWEKSDEGAIREASPDFAFA